MSKRVIVGPQWVPDANRQGFLLDTAEKALNCAVAWLGSGQALLGLVWLARLFFTDVSAQGFVNGVWGLKLSGERVAEYCAGSKRKQSSRRYS